MDAVISFVNNTDPEWLKTYNQYISNLPHPEGSFRDWGFLKYVLRGIDFNLKFIENVFLVVSSISQVPKEINTEKIRVITHDMFIPQKFLPTFNSNVIEAFLHKIPGLSEKFLYFNDDMIPILKCDESIFFTNGKPNIYLRSDVDPETGFGKIVANSSMIAGMAVDRKYNKSFNFRETICPQHTIAPMLCSKNEECYELVGNEIETSLTPIRTTRNVAQYIYTDYLY